MPSALRARRAFALLGVVLALAGSAAARDITVIKDYTAEYHLLGADSAGFHQQTIPIHPISEIEVSGALGRVTDGVGTYLFGMTEKGIATRRIDWDLGGHISEIRLGDRVAVARGSLETAIYALGTERISARVITSPVNRIEISGNLVFVELDQTIVLFGAGATRVTHLQLPSRQFRKVTAAANNMVIDWGAATYLYSANAAGIFGIRIDRHGQRPSEVMMGGVVSTFLPSPEVGEPPARPPGGLPGRPLP